MKRGYNSKRFYKVRLASGALGWRYRLQTLYPTFEEFKRYSDIYDLAQRLRGNSAIEVWNANPIVQGGLNLSDFHLV
jgi:hypothetical protein